MNIKKITLNDFMSYKHVEIDFTENGIYNLIGHNGAGKSAIRDAITWCLFGKSRVSGAGDDLINKNEESMYVTLDVTIDGRNYTIARSKERGQSTKLEVVEDDN